MNYIEVKLDLKWKTYEKGKREIHNYVNFVAKKNGKHMSYPQVKC